MTSTPGRSAGRVSPRSPVGVSDSAVYGVRPGAGRRRFVGAGGGRNRAGTSITAGSGWERSGREGSGTRTGASTPIVHGLTLSTPAHVVQRLADALTRYRKRTGTRWRGYGVWLQAVLTCAWLEGGYTHRSLAEGNGIPRETCCRSIGEGIKVLARRALPLTEVARQPARAGGPPDRRRRQRPHRTDRRQVHQARVHQTTALVLRQDHRHGGNVRTVAAPDGELLWVSGVLPGRTVDITAARRFKIADRVLQFLGLLADLGNAGLHPGRSSATSADAGRKPRRRAGRPSTCAIAGLRAIGERANAQPKQFKVLACVSTSTPHRSWASSLRKRGWAELKRGWAELKSGALTATARRASWRVTARRAALMTGASPPPVITADPTRSDQALTGECALSCTGHHLNGSSGWLVDTHAWGGQVVAPPTGSDGNPLRMITQAAAAPLPGRIADAPCRQALDPLSCPTCKVAHRCREVARFGPRGTGSARCCGSTPSWPWCSRWPSTRQGHTKRTVPMRHCPREPGAWGDQSEIVYLSETEGSWLPSVNVPGRRAPFGAVRLRRGCRLAGRAGHDRGVQ
jgi:hypothetical protein